MWQLHGIINNQILGIKGLSNSPCCLLYISYDVILENFVLDQLISKCLFSALMCVTVLQEPT